MIAISSRIAWASAPPGPVSTWAGTNRSGDEISMTTPTLARLPLGLIKMSEPPAEVRERLLTAWQGEILAGALYDLIARRLDEREADILHRMAEAEGGHRRRLEERMRQLGIAV